MLKNASKMMKNIIFYYFCVAISRIEGVHSVGEIRYFIQTRENGFVPDTTGKKRIYSRNVKRDRQLNVKLIVLELWKKELLYSYCLFAMYAPMHLHKMFVAKFKMSSILPSVMQQSFCVTPVILVL